MPERFQKRFVEMDEEKLKLQGIEPLTVIEARLCAWDVVETPLPKFDEEMRTPTSILTLFARSTRGDNDRNYDLSLVLYFCMECRREVNW